SRETLAPHERAHTQPAPPDRRKSRSAIRPERRVFTAFQARTAGVARRKPPGRPPFHVKHLPGPPAHSRAPDDALLSRNARLYSCPHIEPVHGPDAPPHRHRQPE